MDVTRLLESDHREVEDLFDRIDSAEGAERTPFVEQLAVALRAHMKLEEGVVYPAMASVTGQGAVREGETEHDVARTTLAEVERLAPDEPGFGAAFEALKAAISHHVVEEEDEVFPQLRREGADTLARMATPFMTKRLELGLPMPAEAIAKSATKDELVDEATNVGVTNAGSLTKDELAEALSAAMA